MSEIQPATDEEIAAWQDRGLGVTGSTTANQWAACLVARIRQEQAEADDYQRRWHEERKVSNALQAEVERLRASLSEAYLKAIDLGWVYYSQRWGAALQPPAPAEVPNG